MNCPHCGKGLNLVKAPETPAMQTKPSEPAPKKVPAGPLKLVKCNRCGADDLCWQESKSGKFYLCKTMKDASGQLVALRKEFHQCKQ
jgi:hypothetical protein